LLRQSDRAREALSNGVLSRCQPLEYRAGPHRSFTARGGEALHHACVRGGSARKRRASRLNSGSRSRSGRRRRARSLPRLIDQVAAILQSAFIFEIASQVARVVVVCRTGQIVRRQLRISQSWLGSAGRISAAETVHERKKAMRWVTTVRRAFLTRGMR